MYTTGNKIGETGIKAIQEAMKTNTTLVNLGIDGFFIVSIMEMRKHLLHGL